LALSNQRAFDILCALKDGDFHGAWTAAVVVESQEARNRAFDTEIAALDTDTCDATSTGR
jgi:hypothetical protein